MQVASQQETVLVRVCSQQRLQPQAAAVAAAKIRLFKAVQLLCSGGSICWAACHDAGRDTFLAIDLPDSTMSWMRQALPEPDAGDCPDPGVNQRSITARRRLVVATELLLPLLLLLVLFSLAWLSRLWGVLMLRLEQLPACVSLK
jgi:hypothetical protein